MARNSCVARTVVLILVLGLGSGCAHLRSGEPPACGAIGALAGVGIGVAAGSGDGGHADAIGYGAASAILLGAGGYLLCQHLWAPSEDERLVSAFEDLGLTARITERGVVVYLPDVLFAFGSEALDDSARGRVEAVADVIARFGGERPIAVEGHTDSRGSEVFNQRLSQQRARSVGAVLADRGLGAERLKERGYGESYPIAPNESPDGTDNPEGRAQNRRVEIVIERLR